MSRKDNLAQTVNIIKQELPDVIIKLHEPLKNHTTFKIGGPVYAMLFPESVKDLTKICEISGRYESIPFIIGNGSNILASNKNHDIIVIKTSNINNISLVNEGSSATQGNVLIKVDAGVLLSEAAVFACKNSLTGFEFAHGIPGTAGGAVVMNAGAYGREMKDVVHSTTIYNKTLGKQELTATDNGFSYRRSRFSGTDDVILSTVIQLEKGDRAVIENKINDFDNRRKNSQPLEFPSGGSTFKRPAEGYAAALIEQAGLKGYSNGGAQVSEKHTGFVINRGNASFEDTVAVIEHVQETVFKQFGVQLELEVKVLG